MRGCVVKNGRCEAEALACEGGAGVVVPGASVAPGVRL